MAEQYPESVFDVLDDHYRQLVEEGFRIDGRSIDERIPQRPITPMELKSRLLHPSTPYDVRDVVWRYLITKARGSQTWMSVALGMMQPGMRIAAGKLVQRLGADPEDVDSEFLTGVIAAISEVDLTGVKIANSLLNAGVARVRLTCTQPADVFVEPSDADSHPEMPLWRAVANNIISKQDAELIAATRLGGETLADLAARYGMSASGLNVRRWRAERALCDWLRADDQGI